MARLSELARTSTVPVPAEARSKIPPEVFALYMDAMAPLDARHYIGHAAPSRFFFQFAHDDTSVVEGDGQYYFELASEPKQIAWYDNCVQCSCSSRACHLALRAVWFAEPISGDSKSSEAGSVSSST